MKQYTLVLFASLVVVGGSARPADVQTPASSSSAAPIIIMIRSQAIVRSGPHPFREVKAALVNTGKSSIAVLGRKHERGFDPAGEATVFDAAKNTWTPERLSWTAAEIADDAPDRYTLKAGKTLEFTRTLSPSFGGKRIRIDAYYVLDRAGRPERVTSDAFDLK